MSFLAPLFLLGGLAIALPVVFHLVRRTTRERRLFSSLMFLHPSPPRLTRRSRLEHLLLLLLRCVALGLLALGFARPFLQSPAPEPARAATHRRMIVLLDSSASMRRAGVWPAARAKLDGFLNQTGPADELAVFTFDRQLTSLITFADWKAAPVSARAALVRTRLAGVEPGWAGTALDQALISAADLLADPGEGGGSGQRQIMVISDLQEGARLNALAAHEWPAGIEVLTERVAPAHHGNAGLQWIEDSPDGGPVAAPGFRVRVSNATDSPREQFQVGWARDQAGGLVGPAVDVYVPPGQSRVTSLPDPPPGAGADRVRLLGDEEAFDNTVFLLPAEKSRVDVGYLGPEAETDVRQPLYFLRRAFQETRRQSVRVLAEPPGAFVSREASNAAPLLIVTGALSPAQAGGLRDQLLQGRTVLFAPVDAAAGGALAGLLGIERVAIEDRSFANYGLLGEIDFRHPLFAPFTDPRFSDFTKVHFWKYRRLDAGALPGANVLARFDNGDAAWFEVPVGAGRLVVLTSGWHPADSQLALSSKFVPLLYSLLDLAGGTARAPAQYVVGDTVPPPTETPSGGATLTRPDGSQVAIPAGGAQGAVTALPGIYTLGPVGGAKRFVVNLDPSESLTAPLPPDELERRGLPVVAPVPDAAQQAGRQARWRDAELEERQKLWRWFALAAILVLLTETAVAGWSARAAGRLEGVPA